MPRPIRQKLHPAGYIPEYLQEDRKGKEEKKGKRRKRKGGEAQGKRGRRTAEREEKRFHFKPWFNVKIKLF